MCDCEVHIQMETVLFPVSRSSSYVDVCKVNCLRFKELYTRSFMLRYSLSDYSNCVLANENDFDIMLACLTIAKVKSVDILVKDISLCGEVLSMGNDLVQWNDGGSLSCATSSSCKDRNNFLGRSKTASSKALLSNEWLHYIHHVGQKFEDGVEDFRIQLCKYALEAGFSFVHLNNDKSRVIAVYFIIKFKC